MPFRSICKEMGADIVFTPMLSSDAIIYNSKKTLHIAKFLPEEQPVIVQIFGYDGEKITKAANIVNEKLKPAGIDINMGCPAPKITGNECGSGLLRDPDKAVEIAKIVRQKYKGQLSIKLRLGWNTFNVREMCRKLEKIGVNALIIHGRTAKQKYTGYADWNAIYEIAKDVKISVIGNGDITDWKLAYSLLLNSDLAGVMIGRGALGNPWIFKEIKEQKDIKVSKYELARVIDVQTEKSIKYVGDEKIAIREMRKHLGWYIKGFTGAQDIRKQAMKAETYNDVKKIINLL